MTFSSPHSLFTGIAAAAVLVLPLTGLVAPASPAEWAVLPVIWIFVMAVFDPERFRRRFIPPISAEGLGALRVWTSLILIPYALKGDLAGTARLPREMLRSMGVMDWLRAIPGFDGLLVNPAVLGAFQALTVAMLVLAALGLYTRVTVPLASLCYLVYLGTFWTYIYFFHQSLVAWMVLTALAFTPCGDGLSLDRAWRRRPPSGSPEVWAWSRYLCWVALALPYFLAGLSKVRNGGFGWWQAENLRAKVYSDSVQGGIFDPAPGLAAIGAPDWLFASIGLVTMIAEIGFVSVLFSAWARRILPVCAIGMHLGILALQNFTFFDAMLLQAIWFDWSRTGAWMRRRWRQTAQALESPPPTSEASRPPVWPAVVALDVVLVLSGGWLARAEHFPLSSWKMYSSTILDQRIFYTKILARRSDSRWEPMPYWRCFPTPTFNPFIGLPSLALRGAPGARRFFEACADKFNIAFPQDAPYTAVRLERWMWDYTDGRRSPPFGRLADRVTLQLDRRSSEQRE